MPTRTHLKNRYYKQAFFLLFSLLIFIGIFVYLFSIVSVQEVVTLIKGLSLQWVLLFLVLSFSMSLFRTWRYALLLNASGYQPHPIALFLITLVRNLFSDLLPARLGTLIYIYLVQNRLKIPFGAAAASFSLAFVFDILSLAFFIVIATLSLTSEIISPLMMAVGGGILALCSGCILVLLPGIFQLLAQMSQSIPLVSEEYRQLFYKALADVRNDIQQTQNQKIYWKIFSLSLGVRVCKYVSLYVLFLALVLPLGFSVQSFPLAKVFLGLCSAELAASLPISGIAGFGAYEGAWAIVFQLLGYSQNIAALTSISHHLLTQVYGYSLGAISLLVLILPFFPVSPLRNEAIAQPVPNRFFWIKLISTAVVLFIFCLFMLPGHNSSQTIQRLPQKNFMRTGSVDTLHQRPPMPSGKVVYQRPDGIYTIKIGDKKPQRLAENGTSPRWSPDGKHVAFVDGNRIMLVASGGGKPEVVTTASKAKAVCFTPDGRSLLFTDDTYLRQVDLASKSISTVLKGYTFLEIDAAGDGSRIVATVRTVLGYSVRLFDLHTGESRTVARGCSASFSQDGSIVTVNDQQHHTLQLYQWDSLKQVGQITATSGKKFDNHFWSNSPHWIVSTWEGERHDIYIHHVPSNTSYRITSSGDSDRGDLFVLEQK